MKRRFLAVNDYGTGAGACWITARSVEEVFAVLPSPDWQVFGENDPERPSNYDGLSLLESDIDDKAPWLLELSYIQERQSEGKHAFPVRGSASGVPEYRWIWAHDAAAISSRYSRLEVLFGKPVSWEAHQDMGHSDVDIPDDFLARYQDDA